MEWNSVAREGKKCRKMLEEEFAVFDKMTGSGITLNLSDKVLCEVAVEITVKDMGKSRKFCI